MDIFNKKALEELKDKNAKLEKEKDRLIEDLAELTTKFEEMGKLEASEPPDCKRGPWCRACEFVKTYHCKDYYSGLFSGITMTGYMCGKGESCKHFVQKEIE